jgi:hypothetical protein
MLQRQGGLQRVSAYCLGHCMVGVPRRQDYRVALNRTLHQGPMLGGVHQEGMKKFCCAAFEDCAELRAMVCNFRNTLVKIALQQALEEAFYAA